MDAQRLFIEASSLSNGAKPDSDRAIQLLRQATELWRAEGSEVRRAHALMLLGRLEARAGDFPFARKSFQAATELYRRRGEEACRLHAIRHFQRAYSQLPVTGAPTDDEFLVLWKAVGDRRGIADTYSALAGNAHRAADLSRSLDLEKQGLAIRIRIGDREGRIRSMEGIGTLALARKDYQAALQIAEEVLALRKAEGRPRDIAAAESGVAITCDMAGTLGQAVAHYQRAVELHHVNGDVSAEAACRRALSGVLVRAGDPDAALHEIQEALRLQRQLIERFDSPVARTQFAAYGETLRSLMVTVSRSNRASPSEEKVAAAFEEVDRFFALCLRWTDRESSIGAIRAALDEETVLLTCESSADESGLWIVTQGGVTFHTLPGEQELKTLIDSAYPRIATAPLAGLPYPPERTSALQKLSEVLLKPAVSQLARRRILVMGDSLVQRVPFALLDDPLAPPGTPLIHSHEIAYLPSAGAVIASRKPVRGPLPGGSVTVVADPYSSSTAAPADLQRAAEAAGPFPLPRLPFARKEAAEVARIAPPGTARMFLDQAANRGVFSNPAFSSARIIHFATHAIVNPADPELSGLVLSDRGENNRPLDPFVRLRDLNDLRLDAELVVLSGCRTARGAEPPGMVAVSLATSFLRAGASRVVATAWKVDDEATAAFMGHFYRAYFNGTPAIAALRQAQLTMASSTRWRDPFYWAGFQLYGDWR